MQLDDYSLTKPLQTTKDSVSDAPHKTAYFRSSCISKIYFTWIYPTIRVASTKPLEFEDTHGLRQRETARSQVLDYIPGKLLRSIIKNYSVDLIFIMIFHTLDCMLSFVGPLYVIYLESFFESDSPIYYGFVSLAVVTLIFQLYTIVVTQVYWRGLTLRLNVQSSLTNLVYSKAVKLPAAMSTGETVNILQVDVQRVYEFMPWINNLILMPIQIIVAILLMFYVIGWSAAVGIGTLTVMLTFNMCLFGMYEKFNEVLMEAKDSRMKYTNEMFSNIKLIKIYCFEKIFRSKISQFRLHELKQLRKIMWTGCVLTFLLWSAPIVTCVAMFMSYEYLQGETLDSATAFTILAILNVLQEPLIELPITIGMLTQARVSTKRIDEFLQSEEIKPNSEQTDDGYIHFDNASFSYKDELILKGITLKIKPGEFVAIVGPVGCGKSSILNAILGEMYIKQGNLKLGGSLAYTASLETWIQNSSLKENIIFNNPENEIRYQMVLDACNLNPDISTLPAGDQTEIGERGINLSGGQKARVGLARALYSDRDIYLLDDPLASVDNSVAKRLFSKCFMECLRGKTRILVTHSTSFLHLVDRVIVMKEGSIEQIGNIDSIQINSSLIRESVGTPAAQAGGESKLIKEEDREFGKVGSHVYRKYFKYSGGAILGVLVLIVMVIWQGLQITSEIYLKNWGDYGGQDVIMLYIYLSSAAAFSIFIRVLVIYMCSLRASRKIFEKMMKSLSKAPINLFYDITPIGRILNRLSSDQDEIDTNIPRQMEELLATAFNFIGTIVICAYFVYWVLIVVPFILLISLFIQKKYIRASRELSRLEHISKSPIVNNFTETISGIKTIRCYNAGGKFEGKNEKYLNENVRVGFNNVAMTMWMAAMLDLMSMMFWVAVVGLLIWDRDNVSPGVAGLCIAHLLTLSQNVIMCISFWSETEKSMVAVERADNFIKIQPEAPYKTEQDSLLKDWPERGSIEFQEVSLRYRPNTNLVLQGLSFKIYEKEKIGIVGRTGSGKSSITMAVLRIVELTRGKILIDETDISTLGLKKLRQAITLIPQDPVLFKGTLRFNLDPYERTDDEVTYNILRGVGLGHFNLNDEVSEGGTNYSVGERQLMCIARAAINSTKILILDEATAAIDLPTHNRIQEFLKERFTDTTMIIIAHRLDTVMECNRVLVLDTGSVAEFEDPKVLLKDVNSSFYNLAKQLVQ
jgi:ABC-type multidrug transport system fused ATPase/permease subunit